MSCVFNQCRALLLRHLLQFIMRSLWFCHSWTCVKMTEWHPNITKRKHNCSYLKNPLPNRTNHYCQKGVHGVKNEVLIALVYFNFLFRWLDKWPKHLYYPPGNISLAQQVILCCHPSNLVSILADALSCNDSCAVNEPILNSLQFSIRAPHLSFSPQWLDKRRKA